MSGKLGQQNQVVSEWTAPVRGDEHINVEGQTMQMETKRGRLSNNNECTVKGSEQCG